MIETNMELMKQFIIQLVQGLASYVMTEPFIYFVGLWICLWVIHIIMDLVHLWSNKHYD